MITGLILIVYRFIRFVYCQLVDNRSGPMSAQCAPKRLYFFTKKLVKNTTSRPTEIIINFFLVNTKLEIFPHDILQLSSIFHWLIKYDHNLHYLNTFIILQLFYSSLAHGKKLTTSRVNDTKFSDTWWPNNDKGYLAAYTVDIRTILRHALLYYQ